MQAGRKPQAEQTRLPDRTYQTQLLRPNLARLPPLRHQELARPQRRTRNPRQMRPTGRVRYQTSLLPPEPLAKATMPHRGILLMRRLLLRRIEVRVKATITRPQKELASQQRNLNKFLARDKSALRPDQRLPPHLHNAKTLGRQTIRSLFPRTTTLSWHRSTWARPIQGWAGTSTLTRDAVELTCLRPL
ncbi:hypothetical protein NEOLEDRAFT_338739 [Neolentinus lepideus HHB14362 ss-1]|uniref:Uncharacterized protein n=1 Tax=Neolentinus lepideus HHB14362 ss-1 TaxID=1314782 RepID=A0A165SVW0_9AGAM|nr:hypothetical protein NEOLEDRAFT_338739 [Neolentinus lepideus HHB14362 ss-1]